MSGKEPKRYQCLSCSIKSSRCKVQRFPGIAFAVCFECRGRVKESEEWLNWMEKSRKRIKQQAIKHGNGYLMGVDILTAKERANLEEEKTR